MLTAETQAAAMDSKRHLHGGFTFKIEKADNESFIASITQHERKAKEDNVGALYYVIVVILIYGCSILMMIASYIRKNKVDQRLNRYFKEMATVRKREEQIQLFNAAAMAAALQNSENNGGERQSSADFTASTRSSFHGKKKRASAPLPGVSECKPGDIEMKQIPGKAVMVRQGSVILPARTVSSTSSVSSISRKDRPSIRNSVRFVNEQSDVDSDNDVFLSTDQEGSNLKVTPCQSPVSLRPSPCTSPYLTPTPRPRRTLKLIEAHDDASEFSQSRQSSVTDTDQQSMDTEMSPLMSKCSDGDSRQELPVTPQSRRGSTCKPDYQVVSTV